MATAPERQSTREYTEDLWRPLEGPAGAIICWPLLAAISVWGLLAWSYQLAAAWASPGYTGRSSGDSTWSISFSGLAFRMPEL